MILDNWQIYRINDDLLEQIFAFLIQDFFGFSLRMVLSDDNTSAQEEIFRAMLRQPVMDRTAFEEV